MSYQRYKLQRGGEGGHEGEDRDEMANLRRIARREYDEDEERYHRKQGKNKKKLPPLRDRGNIQMRDVNNPLPVQLRGQTIVSLPDSDGRQEKLNLDDNYGQQPYRRPEKHRHPQHTHDNLEMAIYFMDNEYLKMSVKGGEEWSAGDLFEEVMNACALPDVARHAFSLWLVSDLLEVQLKPEQCPFKLVCFWDELLEKYTQEDLKTCDRDEPLVMFQRNVFYPLEKERQITDQEVIRLLYNEAKESVLDGRYPLEQKEYDALAGLKALIDCKVYDEQIHTPKSFRPRLREFYPDHMTEVKGFHIFRSKNAPEFKLIENMSRAYRSYGRLINQEAMYHCQRAYLEYCWKLPFYGSAFFKGQMEKPTGFFRDDDPVYVAINLNGLFITDMDDVKLRLELPHGTFKWQFAEPPPAELRKSRTMMPAVFIHYTDPKTQKMEKLRVFSREGDMIDNMLTACKRVLSVTKSKRRR